MSNLSNAGIIITIIIAGLGIVFYAVSAPNIMIAMQHHGSTLYGGQDIPISIHREDSKLKRWSNVCFRIENQGQSIPSGEIPASNFQISFKTNAICEECASFTNIQTLDAQESVNYCEKIKAPTGSDHLSFEITANYDAIVSRSVSASYTCELTNEQENINEYKCRP